jgi:hypothetical protein
MSNKMKTVFWLTVTVAIPLVGCVNVTPSRTTRYTISAGGLVFVAGYTEHDSARPERLPYDYLH